MLQIASGKFFRQKPARSNELRGVVYTNLQLYNREPIETTAGRLLSTSYLHNAKTAVYELTEQMEDELAPGVVASHGIDPYLNDFAAIVSFALNVTCTPDPELARRLTSGLPGTLVDVPPRSLVRRVFDDQVSCRDKDADLLVKTADDLIGLGRSDYVVAMRAIRNYVKGLHRLADDPELTYTLLVASIESLAQSFDVNGLDWEDYPEDKRHKIDIALAEADDKTIRQVRKALLDIEHMAARRRFRDFAVNHVKPTFYREEALDIDNPVGQADLPGALNQAYDLRSRHIHTLTELPSLLTTGFHHGETMDLNGVTMMTFQGITRLSRHVITEFINRKLKMTKEAYDYRPERAGIVEVPLAPEYWIGRAKDLTPSSGQKCLEGFLTQVAEGLREGTKATVTDLRKMLMKVEKLLPNMSTKQRRPFLTLYILFNTLVIGNAPNDNLERVTKRYGKESEIPSVEAMLIHLLLGTVPTWSLEDHRAVHDGYLRDQGKRTCLRIPRSLRANLSLALAERYRDSGDAERARELVATAVENDPGNEVLWYQEQNFNPEVPVKWRIEALSAHPTAKPGTELPAAGLTIFRSGSSDQR